MVDSRVELHRELKNKSVVLDPRIGTTKQGTIVVDERRRKV